MKIFFIGFIACLSACATVGTKSSKNLGMELFSKFAVGKTTEAEVISNLNMPFLKEENLGETVLTFYDQRNHPRFLASFNSKTRKLTGYNWMPYDENRESEITAAKEYFPKAKFVEIETFEDHGHYFRTTWELVDIKEGVSIYLSQNRQVEYIQLFDPALRKPITETKITKRFPANR
jgi:hypothetical protein